MPRPAPVTIATRPSKRCSAGTWSGGRGGIETQDLGQGAADEGRPLVVGDTRELLRDQLAAAPEGALRVGVVVAPHDGRHAGDVAGRDGYGVVPERDGELPPPVLAWPQRGRPHLGVG